MHTDELISLNDAAAKGIERLRKPVWTDPMEHIKIDAIDGRLGPWVRLYSPGSLSCNGEDPVAMLLSTCGNLAEKALVPYTGPLPDSDEYKAAQARFQS